ncbi:hypothetical protein [uncultured Roseobacter sp.]|uniref:hypothetical protein n=1 Tax=uncultured Roseobacter sp. TaxID=114847 RepID=UPI002618C7E5|nr:hypothetical protein [uncultured Roseobacter sp.]
MNKIFEAIRDSSSSDLQELASELWMQFDMTHSNHSETASQGDEASTGAVMEALLIIAKRHGGHSE